MFFLVFFLLFIGASEDISFCNCRRYPNHIKASSSSSSSSS